MVDQRPIIESGIAALAAVRDNIDQVFARRPEPRPPGQGSLISNAEMIQSLEQICISQAHAFACLFDDGRRATEAPRLEKMRRERVSQVRAHCEGIDITELRNRGVRNALAHFDERYLKAIVDHGDKGGWIQDLALSHMKMFNLGEDGTQRMIRVYIFENDTLYLFGEELHLTNLRRASDEALGRLLKACNLQIKAPEPVT
jgi:hypothetical protein